MSAIYALTPPALSRGAGAWTGLIALLLLVPGCSGGDGSPGPEQLYLNALHSSQNVHIDGSDEDLLEQGHWACGQIRQGATPQEVAARLSDKHHVPVSAASVQVSAATSNLCPDAH